MGCTCASSWPRPVDPSGRTSAPADVVEQPACPSLMAKARCTETADALAHKPPPAALIVLEQHPTLVEQRLPIQSLCGVDRGALSLGKEHKVPFDVEVGLESSYLLTEVEVVCSIEPSLLLQHRWEIVVGGIVVAVGYLNAPSTSSTRARGTRIVETKLAQLRCRMLLDEPIDCVREFTLRATSSAPGAHSAPLASCDVGAVTLCDIVPRGLPVGSHRPRRRMLEPPAYWNHIADSPDTRIDLQDVEDRCPGMIFQRLLDETWTGRATRDRHGSVPKRLVVRKVQRIEVLSLWNRYARQRRQMLLARGGLPCTPVAELGRLHGSVGRRSSGAAGCGKPVRTQEICDDAPDLLGPCQREVNEHYLFHGTSPTGALGIIKRGFDFSKAGTSTGLMFGPGAYFAEASSKFDEYAQPDELSGMCAVLVCRVVCGEMHHTTGRPDRTMLADPSFTAKFDGILGDREAAVGTYREFVVFRPEQIYPEYLVIYDRVP
eukprot:TRINITY_DN16418_c0_g1_i1.p1 TRINITY_DN16418_c0_g1~~TRINITY_DN16418_c0_g1_i1.p1  ORF type:complete len:490 (+),score=23.39 TRINITY_DN16418_c0_g1_i1:97-1566(+)